MIKTIFFSLLVSGAAFGAELETIKCECWISHEVRFPGDHIPRTIGRKLGTVTVQADIQDYDMSAQRACMKKFKDLEAYPGNCKVQ